MPTYVVEDKDDKSKGGKGAVPPQDAQGDPRRAQAGGDKAEHVYLATDPDREGEAIAWHIEDELKLDDATHLPHRLQRDHPGGGAAGARPPRQDRHDRVKAQEARRILDRVVGLSAEQPARAEGDAGLSAGRVQSVAVRLIVEREREIEAFKPEEYWKIAALCAAGVRSAIAAEAVRGDVLPREKGSDGGRGEETARRRRAPQSRRPEAPRGRSGPS